MNALLYFNLSLSIICEYDSDAFFLSSAAHTLYACTLLLPSVNTHRLQSAPAFFFYFGFVFFDLPCLLTMRGF